MRRSAQLVGLLALAVLAVVAVAAIGAELGDQQPEPEADFGLEQRWLTEETRTSLGGNHHQPVVVRADGEPRVVVPLNGRGEDCRVAALDASGDEVWDHEIDPDECDVHAVGDVAAETFPGEEPSVLLATGEERTLALSATDGELRLEHELPDFGYSPPVVLGADDPTLVVADFTGAVVAVGSDGERRWRRDVGGYVWARPTVGTLANGTERVVVSSGESGDYGVVHGFDAAGEATWSANLSTPSRSLARTAVDGEPVVVAGTAGGSVVALRVRDGERLWDRSFEGAQRVAAEDAAGGAVYAVSETGDVRRLEPSTGTSEWERTLGGPYEVAMRVELADLGHDAPAPAVLTPEGAIHLLDPVDGATLALHDADRTVFSPPTAADVTADGRDDLVVVYEHGETALLTYEPDEAESSGDG